MGSEMCIRDRYYYKTGREEHARLEQLESLSTQISFEILQYRAVAEFGEK